MQELDDISLLRDYTERHSEKAFAMLVTRHINKVYSVALRHTRNPHQAEEITQAVFVILAQKSRKLSNNVILSGWLYETARLTAITFIRSEIRRTRREQEASMQTEPSEIESDVWPQIAPLLDAAMAGLSERDRHAVVLRFFDGKSMREIGAALGASEGAAKMRVNRAVEKLRLFFTKRGVVVPAAVLTVAISANSAQAAPAALAKAATAVALANGVTGSPTTLTLTKGALKLMAWTKAQGAIVTGAILLLIAGTTAVTVREIAVYRSEEWRVRMDVSVLDSAPRQVKILPALRSRPNVISGWEEYHGMLLGLNQSMPEIVFAAYNDGRFPSISRARMIFSDPIPEGTYDFISNVPKNQKEALQQEITKEFGLAGRLEWIETNVLLMIVRNPNATGLKRSVSAPAESSRTNGILSFSNFPTTNLPVLLEDLRPGTPVVDRTGLTGYFDLKWDRKHDSLEKAVLEQLGLELVPGQDRVEFLVIDKTNSP
jgi:uncharacterized protein (TIGR03435 family)